MLPLSLARQTWPRRGSPQAWQRFLDSTPDSRSLRPFSMRCQRLRMDGTVLQGRRSTTRPHLGPSRLTTARMIWSSSGDQQLPRHVTGAATSPMKAERRANICFDHFEANFGFDYFLLWDEYIYTICLSCRARRTQKRLRMEGV